MTDATTATPRDEPSLRVATVGTGTGVPRLDRGGPCTLVRVGRTAVAVDLGLGALHGLLRLGVTHRDLAAVLCTHLHPDHVAELPSFLFAATYDERPRTAPLLLAGGAGLAGYREALAAAHGRWLEARGYQLTLRELAPGDGVVLEGLEIRAGAVRHLAGSLAYRFSWHGRSAVVTGDSGPSPELEAFADGADLLVAEASLPEGAASEGHLTARHAGGLARRARVGRLLLTHLYPAAEASDPARLAQEAFGGPVEVASDGREVEV